MTTRRALLGSVALGVGALAGCTGTGNGDDEFSVTSPAFDEGDTIPRRYTCDGEGDSPPLDLGSVPADAGALAITMRDPDAPGGTFTHWLLWNLPPDRTNLPAAVAPRETVGDLGDARQGTNDFGDVGYGGACPPEGDGAHTYRIRAHALDAPLDVPAGARADEVLPAIDEATIASDLLTGTVER